MNNHNNLGTPDRVRLTDEQVTAWITYRLSIWPSYVKPLTWNDLLRSLNSAGFTCATRRFRTLFRSIEVTVDRCPAGGDHVWTDEIDESLRNLPHELRWHCEHCGVTMPGTR